MPQHFPCQPVRVSGAAQAGQHHPWPVFLHKYRRIVNITGAGRKEPFHHITQGLAGTVVNITFQLPDHIPFPAVFLHHHGPEDAGPFILPLAGSQPGYYELILMDIQMPVMDGYGAARAIRALEDQKLADIPILAMTANAFEEDKQAALKCGMNGHISKPIDIAKLLETLQNVLRNR